VCHCPACQRFFCRECVVSFDGRLLCAPCIARASQGPVALEKGTSHVGQILLGALALLFIWVVFYFLGWVILQYRETAPMTSSASGIADRA
jgi:hypothetical protein